MDARTWTLALNTLLLAGATCAISLPLGTVLAWLLTRTDVPGRRVAVGMLALMLFVPLYLQTAAWQAGFAVQGWATLAWGFPPWLEDWTGAIWVHAVAAVPWVVLIVGVGLRLVEPELEEQALLDASPGRVFLHVTLRGVVPAIAVAAIWVSINAAGEIAVTDLFRVRTYAEEVYTRAAVGPQLGDAPLGATPGVILSAVLVGAAVVLCAKLLPGERPLSLRPPWVFSLGRWRLPIAILVGIFLAVLVGVPLMNLCCKSGILVTQTDAGRLRSWSLWKCLATVAAAPWQYRREFGWSLSIAALSATAAVLTATVLASLTTLGKRRPGVLRAGLLLSIAVCLAIPGPVVGLAIVRLMNQPWCPPLLWLYDRSIFAPWLATLVRSLPPAALIMWHALRTFPREMLEAAAADGAGPLRRLLLIVLPCRLPALALAWVVAMAVSLGDLAASILVVPPGVTTLSIRIFGLLHSGVEDQVAGVCLALIVLFAAAATVAAWSASRWIRSRRPTRLEHHDIVYNRMRRSP